MRFAATFVRASSVRLLLAVLVAACGPVASVGVASLDVGDCFNEPPEGAPEGVVSSLQTVDCTVAHDDEIFAKVVLNDAPGALFPSIDVVRERALQLCATQFAALFQLALTDTPFDVFALFPTPESWDDDDRTVTCAAYDFQGLKVTGHLADIVAPAPG